MKQRHLLLSMLFTTVSLTLCALSGSHQPLKMCITQTTRPHCWVYCSLSIIFILCLRSLNNHRNICRHYSEDPASFSLRWA